MYIVNIYEEDYSDTHGKILICVGKVKGRFLTEHDAQIEIDNQDYWNKRNFIFRVVNEGSNEAEHTFKIDQQTQHP